MSFESGNGFTLLGDVEPSSSEFLSHQLRVDHSEISIYDSYFLLMPLHHAEKYLFIIKRAQ